ncbi:hypothetical protein B0H34DRAFT_792533 [Crassisporium funariophilum]|nr:hypothetical protein B0H34DRAFT_792533 [Crassisporium funariophilum]
MSSRPSRSSSIPIPRSSSASNPARNLESLISIPFVSSPRPQHSSLSQAPRHITDPPQRRVHNVPIHNVSHASRTIASGSNIPSISPTRQTVRSASLATAVPGRTPNRSLFEPRIIRSSGPEVQPLDLECPIIPSITPSQTRRASVPNTRISTSQKSLPPQHVVARTTPVAFVRPAYLEYSSLRHLLQTEAPVLPVPSRKLEPSSSSSRPQSYSASMSTSSDNDEDSNTTPPREIRPASTSSSGQDPLFRLPVRWSEQDRHIHLSVSADGRDLSHNGGQTNSDKDAASARTVHPIPPACGIYYFEIEIGGKEQKSHISIGLGGRAVKFTRLPGWDANSWGYYGEDGCSLAGDKNGVQYGQPYGTGDIVGCGIDFTTYKVFFTKNGTLIGPVFDNVGRNTDLYPSVGLLHTGESIHANFGQDPFRYDIDYHVQQQRNATWNKILSTPLDSTLLRLFRKTGPVSIAAITNDVDEKTSISEEESRGVLNKLVMTYLIHHGYAKTARAFEKQLGDGGNDAIRESEGGADVEIHWASNKLRDIVESDIERRTNVVNYVLAGQIDLAIDAVRKHYPKVLEAENHLMLFKLRCRKFVELILETTEMKKKMKNLRDNESERHKEIVPIEDTWMDEEMNMDVDDDASSTKPLSINPSVVQHGLYATRDAQDTDRAENAAAQYENALNAAIFYGQALSNDYQSDSRPELQQLFKKTFGIVAWEDPLEAGGSIADIAGHDSRIALAHELNQAILKSLGRPVQPALETVYRHASACVTQLGLYGVGAAAFADMPREFLQS